MKGLFLILSWPILVSGLWAVTVYAQTDINSHQSQGNEKLLQINTPINSNDVLADYKNEIKWAFGRVKGMEIEFYDEQKIETGTSVSIKLRIKPSFFKNNLSKMGETEQAVILNLSETTQGMERQLRNVEQNLKNLDLTAPPRPDKKSKKEIQEAWNKYVGLRNEIVRAQTQISTVIAGNSQEITNIQKKYLNKVASFTIRFNSYLEKYSHDQARLNQLKFGLVATIDQLANAIGATSPQYEFHNLNYPALAGKKGEFDAGVHDLFYTGRQLYNIGRENWFMLVEPRFPEFVPKILASHPEYSTVTYAGVFTKNDGNTDHCFFQYYPFVRIETLSSVQFNVDFSNSIDNDAATQPMHQRIASTWFIDPLWFLGTLSTTRNKLYEKKKTSHETNLPPGSADPGFDAQNSDKDVKFGDITYQSNDTSARLRCESYAMRTFSQKVKNETEFLKNNIVQDSVFLRINQPHCLVIKVNELGRNEKTSQTDFHRLQDSKWYTMEGDPAQGTPIEIHHWAWLESESIDLLRQSSTFSTGVEYWAPAVEIEYFRNAFEQR